MPLDMGGLPGGGPGGPIDVDPLAPEDDIAAGQCLRW